MSVLIKADMAHLLVRPFAGPAPPDDDQLTADLLVDEAGETARIATLEQENESLRAALAEAADSARAAEDRAREEGRQAGLESARRADDQRVDRLRGGIEAALAAWQDRLGELDRLAPLIAQTALAKLFDDEGNRLDLVTRIIRRQLVRLRRETVVAIRVSLDDFPNEATVAELHRVPGVGEVELIRDSALAAGECRLDLRLGQIDIGPATQWRALSALLLELSEEAAA